MIKNLKLIEAASEDEYKVVGEYESEIDDLELGDGDSIELVFFHNHENGERKEGEVVVKYKDNQLMSWGAPVKLKRGVYSVRYRRYDKDQQYINPKEYTLPYQVMAGKPYPVSITLSTAEISGKRGVQIAVDSGEISIKDHEFSYTINGISKIDGIVFHLPMNEEKSNMFFVEGVDIDQIKMSYSPEAKFAVTFNKQEK